jgi:hypothetical protein
VTDDTFEPRIPDDVVQAADAGGQSTEAAAPGHPTVGAVWQEGTPGHWVIKLSGLPGAPPGQDILLGRTGANNHSPFIADHSATAGHASRIGIAWIESPAGDTSGMGRIMLQRVSGGALGKPIDTTAFTAAANDNATWVADLYGAGAIGCEPTVAELTTGDTLVTWIGVDGHAHGRLYAPVDAYAAGPHDGRWDEPEHGAVNAVLSDLGPVGAAADGARRLQVAELRPGTFAVMWLALAESGPVLRGSLFLTPAATERSGDQGGWIGLPLSDVRLPNGFAGRFSVKAAGDEGEALQVTYADASGAAVVNVLDAPQTTLQEDHGGMELASWHLPGPAAAGAQDETAEHLQQPRNASPAQASGSHGPNPAAPVTPAPAVGADPSVHESALVGQAMQGGLAVAWSPADSADGAQQIKLTLRDENGRPNGPQVQVTDGAASDVAPAIYYLEDDVAAAYVVAGNGALVVEVFAGNGAQIGEAVIDSGDTGTIAEIALGSHGDDTLSVAYVQQSSDAVGHSGGYGNIMFQQYAVRTEDGRPDLVPLGRDGRRDGNDGPTQLTVQGNDSGEPAPVVGRAPSVSGMDDGQLAIIWVESDGAKETIKGSVIDQGGGQLLLIDLTVLLDGAGIAAGTRPTLHDAGDGNFLVSWLQPDGDDDGYVVMSALFTETSPGIWLVPEQAVQLKAFDNLPEDYSVGVSSDDDGTFINVTWMDDSCGRFGDDVYQARYDLEGHRMGRMTKVADDDVVTNDQQSAGDALVAPDLGDGPVVLVYTEQESNGDLALAARVFEVAAPEETSSAGTANEPAVVDRTFATGVDQETAINPLGDQIGAGLIVSHINDVPITTATPVDVGCGWVQLRDDGWLTVTPDAGYTGQVAFDYAVSGPTNGANTTGRVVVNVGADGDAPAAVTLLNELRTVPEDISTAADLKVAEIAVANGALATDGLSLTGLDAGMFKIIGNALYLKEGIELDFDTKPTLSIEIEASHGREDGPAANFTLSVERAGEMASFEAVGDILVFAPDHVDLGGEPPVVGESNIGYATFQELLEAGALIQAGDDVVIALSGGDLADPLKTTLKGAELSALSGSDFKFS